MKEYLKKFKEYRKDPKKRSITLLIIYGLFFIFVFIYIKGATPINSEINNFDNNSIQITNDKDKNEISSYEFEYNINKENELIEIKGTYLDNKDTFIFNSDSININNYYIYSNISNEKIIEFPITKLSYNEINKLINYFEYNSKTEYKDGQIKYEYIISNQDYATYLKEENNVDGKIYIIVSQKDFIENVEIDLKEYYNIENYKININYKNINNISKIENN